MSDCIYGCKIANMWVQLSSMVLFTLNSGKTSKETIANSNAIAHCEWSLTWCEWSWIYCFYINQWLFTVSARDPDHDSGSDLCITRRMYQRCTIWNWINPHKYLFVIFSSQYLNFYAFVPPLGCLYPYSIGVIIFRKHRPNGTSCQP